MTNKINLKKGEIILDVFSFEDSGFHIAFIPALNLTTHSKEKNEALKRIDDAVFLFFDYWRKRGKLDTKLTSLGWIKEKKKLIPSNENIQIPYPLIDKAFSKSQIKAPSFAY